MTGDAELRFFHARTAFETMAGLFEVTPVPMTPADAEDILTAAMRRGITPERQPP